MKSKISKKFFSELGKRGLCVKSGKIVAYAKDDGEYDFCPLIYPNEVVISDGRSFVKVALPNGNTTTISMRDTIKPDKLATALADVGIPLVTQKAKKLCEVFEACVNFCDDISRKAGVDSTGWQENGRFAIPTIDADVEYVDDIPKSNIVPRFVKNGSIEKEIEMLQKMAYARVFVVPLFGLIAPLQYVVGGENFNFVLHIGGLTGAGKSLAVKTAIALWGKPSVAIYGKNWNATLNGLETYWHSMKDVPSWVDEMENSKHLSDVVQAIYSFSEGTGRTRAYSKDGEVLNREVKTFRGVMFTTGEKCFDEVIQSVAGERNAPLGLKRRVLDLDADRIWDSVNKYEIGGILDENYGNFAPKYIEFIAKNKDKVKSIYREALSEFPVKIEGKEKLYAGLITALRILEAIEVIDDGMYEFQKSEIYLLAEADRADFENGRNLPERFIADFREFIAANKDYFVGAGDPERMRGVWGMVDVMNERAYVTKSCFRDFCGKRGYVERQAVQEMKKNGVLWAEKGRNDIKAPTELSKKMGAKTRVYCFSIKTPSEIIEEAEEKGEIPI